VPDKSRTAEELARRRNVVSTAAALLGGAFGLAVSLAAPRWLKAGLGIAFLAILAAAVVLAVWEYRVAHPSEGARPRVSRWWLGVGIGLIAILGAAVLWLGLSGDDRRDVKIDTTVGKGPYSVNGTCYNLSCFLYARERPSVSSRKLARISEGQMLTIACQAKGKAAGILGQGSSMIWDRLNDPNSGPYVSDYFTDTPGRGRFTPGLRRCRTAGAPRP
jgi:hypothetical protein